MAAVASHQPTQPISSLLSPNQPDPQVEEDDYPPSFFVIADHDFTSTDGSALSFSRGDVIEVLTQLESGWWDGLIDGQRGWMPCNYVSPISDEEAERILLEKEERRLAEENRRALGDKVNLNGDDGATNGRSNGDPSSSSRALPNSTSTTSTSYFPNSPASPRGSGRSWLERQINGDLDDESSSTGGGLDTLAREMMRDDERDDEMDSREGERRRVRVGIELGDTPEELMDDEGGDLWVPKITEDNQIYYHNTRTGQDSWELPLSDTASALHSPSLTSPSSSRPTSLQRPLIPSRFASSSSTYAQTYLDKDLASDSPANGFILPRVDGRTGKQRDMGDWLARMRDDGVGYYYVNKETGEVRKEIPGMGVSNGAGRSIEENTAYLNRLRAERNKRSTTDSVAYSDTSGPDSPGIMSTLQVLARNVDGIPERTAGGVSIITSGTGSTVQGTVAWEKRPAERLRMELSGGGMEVDKGRDRIEELSEVVRACVGDIVEASGRCAGLLPQVEEEGVDGPGEERKVAAEDLREAVRRTTPAVRNLLYASRYALLGMSELVNASIPDSITDDPATLSLHERERIYSGSYLSSELIHSPQRRVVAALSKIVFFCHSAVGMDWPLSGSAERLAGDAKDLEAAVGNFVKEVGNLGCLGENGRGARRGEAWFALGEETEDAVMREFDVGSVRRSREWRKLDQEVLSGITPMVEILKEEILGLEKIGKDRQLLVIVGRTVFKSISDLQRDLKRVDVAATLDLDGPVGGSSSAVEASLGQLLGEYRESVAKADTTFRTFEMHFDGLYVSSTALLLLLSTPELEGIETELADALGATSNHLTTLVDLLQEMEILAQYQADAASKGIKGRIGRRSSRVAERERRSILSAKFRPPMPSRDSYDSRRSTRSTMSYVRERQSQGLDAENATDEPEPVPGTATTTTGPSTSQTSLSTSTAPVNRPRKGSSATASRMSPSSSTNSLARFNDDTVSSIRTSTFMRGMSFMRNRSGSEIDINDAKSPQKSSKKKLAKLLGEDNIGEPEKPPLRIQVEKPFYLGVDYSEDDIIINADGSVKAGTLPALVERLTAHDVRDAFYMDTFLMTLGSFASGNEVLDLLCRRYTIEAPSGVTADQLADWVERKQKPVKLRVFNTFKTWVDQYYIESADTDILERIKVFARDVIAKDTTIMMPTQRLIQSVEKRQIDGDAALRKMFTNPTQPPPPIIPRTALRGLQLLDINPLELARQLTIFEAGLYNKIRPIDCLNKAWSQVDKPESGENIKAMILTSNRIAGWVAQTILNFSDPKRRANVMKHLAQTAEFCKSLNNFSTMAAIMAGLNSTPIRRLKRTRDQLSSKTIALLDDLDKTLDSGKNFQAYRDRLKTITPPCIPFLGVYLTFLTFIEDGNANMLPAPSGATNSMVSSASMTSSGASSQTPSSGATISVPAAPKLIHFSKRQKSADVIREIQGYQQDMYVFQEIKSVQEWLKAKLAEVEKGGDMYELSLMVEPREREDEKLARMLRESGMI